MPLLEGRDAGRRPAAAYVCEHFACQAPVTDAASRPGRACSDRASATAVQGLPLHLRRRPSLEVGRLRDLVPRRSSSPPARPTCRASSKTPKATRRPPTCRATPNRPRRWTPPSRCRRRNRARGDRLPARVRPHRRRPPHDRRGRRQMTRSASRAWSPTAQPPPPAAGQLAAGPARAARPAAGCGTPTTTVPGQPAGYAPFVGPVCSTGRQGGDRHRLHQGRRRGRTDRRPGQGLARRDLRPAAAASK